MTFSEAYNSYYGAVFRYSKRRCEGSPIEAEDATQEAFLQAWRIWGRAAEIDNVKNWILGIARKTISHMMRAANEIRRGRNVTNEWSTTAELVPQECSQELSSYVISLKRHFDNLSDKQRKNMELSSLGHSTSEIAKINNVTKQAVQISLCKSRDKLKLLLNDPRPFILS